MTKGGGSVRKMLTLADKVGGGLANAVITEKMPKKLLKNMDFIQLIRTY